MKSSDQHLTELHEEGATIFRAILPPSLITDLRQETDKARDLARKKMGAQVQRLQPIGSYADQLDMKPFEDYRDLPALNEILKEMLTTDHNYGALDAVGILLEPGEKARCTNWHRDLRDHMAKDVFEDEFAEEWKVMIIDMQKCLQVNCALYEDSCTWYVPHSHNRYEAFPEEENVRDAIKDLGLDDLDDVQREAACLNYTKSMPGAFQLHLDPGDFALYRPCGWHIGNYVPYKKRATLHDVVTTGSFKADREKNNLRAQEAKKRLDK
ncbi:MAG: hypothetical protein HRT89_07545 [Lentisphaeria bacterium]|nr:hypothetical protein [Lentisphaeria bacterium]NQZ67907.1 hypothetical protein [Lentisphaeria bacterium]